MTPSRAAASITRAVNAWVAEDEKAAEKRKRAIEKQWDSIAPGVVYVDPRVGSAEFMRPLRALGVRATVSDDLLIAGDFVFKCGHTRSNPFCRGDLGCRIGIERKTLPDLCGSLLKDRMGKQIPDMLDSLTISWILVEGLWRPGGDDCIETFYGGAWQSSRMSLTYSQLSGWLVRYDVYGMGRIHRWRTANPTESMHFLASLFRWWQKEWHRHSETNILKMPAPIKALMFRPTWLHRTAASLPEVGEKGMKKAYGHFKSIIEMINAPEEEWQKVLGSKKDANKVWHEIRRVYR